VNARKTDQNRLVDGAGRTAEQDSLDGLVTADELARRARFLERARVVDERRQESSNAPALEDKAVPPLCTCRTPFAGACSWCRSRGAGEPDRFQVCAYDSLGRWSPGIPDAGIRVDERGWIASGLEAAALTALEAARGGAQHIVVRAEFDGAVMVIENGLIQFPQELAQAQRDLGTERMIAALGTRLALSTTSQETAKASPATSAHARDLEAIRDLAKEPSSEETLGKMFFTAWNSLSSAARRDFLVACHVRVDVAADLLKDGLLDAIASPDRLFIRSPAARELAFMTITRDLGCHVSGALAAHFRRRFPEDARPFDPERYTVNALLAAVWQNLDADERRLALIGMTVPACIAESLYNDGTLKRDARGSKRGLLMDDGRRPSGVVGETPEGPSYSIEWFDEDTIQIAGHEGGRYVGSRAFSLESGRIERIDLLFPRPDRQVAASVGSGKTFSALTDETIRAMYRFAATDQQRIAAAEWAQRTAERTVRSPSLAQNCATLNNLGVRPETLDAPQFRGAFSEGHDGRVIFPHERWPSEDLAARIGLRARGLVGYELVDGRTTRVTAGSGFWESSATAEVFDRIVFVERAIDALSYHQLHPNAHARYVSSGGTLTPVQAELVRGGTVLSPEGARGPKTLTVAAAFSSSREGAALARQLEECLPAGVVFQRAAPERAGSWNDVLQKKERDYLLAQGVALDPREKRLSR
jgi:hypothetical protein